MDLRNQSSGLVESIKENKVVNKREPKNGLKGPK